MNQEIAIQHCKDKGIILKGVLTFDPYCGWIDLSDEYPTGYCIICELNIAEKLCSKCNNKEPCKIS